MNEVENQTGMYYTKPVVFYNQTPSSTIVLSNQTSSANGFTGSVLIGSIASNSSTSTNYPGMMSTCAVADFDGDGKSDLACFPSTGGQAMDYSPIVWFSHASVFGTKYTSQHSMPHTVYGSVGLGASMPLNDPTGRPFGSSCTVGHFVSGPGQDILCVMPEQDGTLPQIDSVGGQTLTSDCYIWKFTGTFPSAGSEALTDTLYTWAGPNHITTSFTGPSGAISDSWSYYANWGSNCMSGDFNGDGLTDVACPDGNGNWNMGLSTGAGFTDSLWTTGDTYHPDCATGDFNGDGKADIICYVDGATNPLRVYLSTGTGFQPVQTWAFPALPVAQNPDSTSPRDNSIFSSVCSLADLNADGKTDIICYSGNNSTQWVYALSTGSGFVTGSFTFAEPPTAYEGNDGYVTGTAMPFSSNAQCSLADITGKGPPEIVCAGASSTAPYTVGIIQRE